MRMVRYVLLQ